MHNVNNYIMSDPELCRLLIQQAKLFKNNNEMDVYALKSVFIAPDYQISYQSDKSACSVQYS